MHLINCSKIEFVPTGQIDVRIVVNAKYRYEPLYYEPHIYKLMGVCVSDVTKSDAIEKLQKAIERVN